jgi:DNA-binding HxlR family transcriptional regulator
MKVLKQECAVDRLCQIFSDRVSFIILERLRERSPQRFGMLLSATAPVSSRTLTLKLRTLTACGVISQERFAERPPRVEYRLTKSGKAFSKVLREMTVWSKRYLPKK